MHIKVTTTDKIYLESCHSNIPLMSSWNQSLSAGLQELAISISEIKHDEVVEIAVERMDEMAEFNAAGDIGYATKSNNNVPTGYYYLDFVISEDGRENSKWYKDPAITQHLNEELNAYLEKEHEYHLDSSKYFLLAGDSDLEFHLRAYFVRG